MAKTKRRWFKTTLVILLCLCLVCGGVVLGVNLRVKAVTADRILTEEQAAALADVDAVLVLGCYVWDDGEPSDMLRDRLTRGVALYDRGAAPKLLMSGDHGQESYDEVNAMKQYAVEAGVPDADVFMDHAGFSTYESLYRAKAIFGTDTLIIVTQEYHLYRALYIADALGIEAYGVAADYHTYRGQLMRDAREMLARVKDVGTCFFKPEPTFLGDAIPISGDGNVTND